MNNPVLTNSSLEGFEVNMNNNVSSDKKLKKELVDKYDKFRFKGSKFKFKRYRRFIN